MEIKYYAGGVELTKEEKNRILKGETDKLLYFSGHPFIPLCRLTDNIMVNNDRLDETDPLLQKALKVVDLPLEKTFIIRVLKGGDDPLDYPRSEIFGYW